MEGEDDEQSGARPSGRTDRRAGRSPISSSQRRLLRAAPAASGTHAIATPAQRLDRVLAEKIHRFTRRLLRTAGTGPAIAEIEASLREDFDTLHAVLLLPEGTAPADHDSSWRFLRRVNSDDPGYRSFDTLFAACKPRCGQIRDSQREYLFGTEAPNIGSVAMIPLGGQPPAGLLALGSVDRDRFHPGMSTEFLGRMGELITDALARG